MSVPVSEWGRRLSDAVRTALAGGEFDSARRLALEGDGQTRSLAKEYTLMYRGLGITLRVLLRLLRDAAARDPSPGASAAASSALVALVRSFRHELATRAAAALGTPAPDDEPAALEEEFARAERALGDIESRFEQEQASAAEEIVSAIVAGDAARGRELIDRKERGQYVPLHDALIRFMADSFAWVLEHGGAQQLVQFHLATAEGQRAGFDKWERMSPQEFAWTSAFLLKQHMGEVAVREDDERFTIEQTPCGSGGRLQLAGAYRGPHALPFVEGPGPLTFGEARAPVYCTHCAIWNGAATLRWFGRAHWVFERPARADGSCLLHVYKRRDGTPPEYAARVHVPPEEG
jgi:hypothetical protein